MLLSFWLFLDSAAQHGLPVLPGRGGLSPFPLLPLTASQVVSELCSSVSHLWNGQAGGGARFPGCDPVPTWPRSQPPPLALIRFWAMSKAPLSALPRLPSFPLLARPALLFSFHSALCRAWHPVFQDWPGGPVRVPCPGPVGWLLQTPWLLTRNAGAGAQQPVRAALLTSELAGPVGRCANRCCSARVGAPSNESVLSTGVPA